MLNRLWAALAPYVPMVASLAIIISNVTSMLIGVYRGGPSPLANTTAFNGFLLIALSLLSSFFATYWTTRRAIERKSEQLHTKLMFDVLPDSSLAEAADAVQDGLAFTGTSTWTLLLIMCFIGMDLPGRMVIPFTFIWIVGTAACTAGIRVLNRMMNPDIRDEILLRTLSKANDLKNSQETEIKPGRPATRSSGA